MQRRKFCQSVLAGATVGALPGGFIWAKETQLADLPGVMLDGQSTTLSAADLAHLKASLRGGMLVPSDANYDQVRQLRNYNIDKRPAQSISPAIISF